ncbi:hypothetical protein PAECIP111893_02394 [Paenibacillus plantiphilus]|uniref:Uncharacterized protein n=1 Tax=Paenibacillus plantiphilus TaxID=2905650 RepID=A0ABM9C8P8_9BACL|nr:hypothetical protein PAECIP111893_02394 [Paenibacillus plantiphilus]
MMRYIKYFLWFMRESYSFMRPHNKLWITLIGITKAHTFAKDMRKWDKLTPEQREAWYLSGDGRMLN